MKRYLVPSFIFMILLRTVAVSQPANDECTTARVLIQTSSCNPVTATTVNATESLPPLVCSGLVGYSDDDVWFTFIATTSHVTIEVDGSPGFDAVVDFREYPCNGTPIACVDATGTGGTELISKTGLYIGNTYLIRVYSYGYGTAAQGTFEICAYGAPPYPPVNDNCSGSIWMLEFPDCQMFTATTVSASQSDAPVFCNGNNGYADDDVWFIFKATTSDPVITVKGTPMFDAVVDLRTGECNGTTLYCSDSSGAGGYEVISTTGLDVDELYHIRIYGYGNGPNDEGEFDICVSENTIIGTGPLIENNETLSVVPNPFSEGCRITYHLDERSRVVIRIFTMHGKEIYSMTDKDMDPGSHQVEFRPGPASDRFTSMVCYLVITIGDTQYQKKIIRVP